MSTASQRESIGLRNRGVVYRHQPVHDDDEDDDDFLCFLYLCTHCTGPTLGCHLLWKRAHPSVLILKHSSLAPICFFTGSIYSSPCQNKTLPPRPCSSLKYSLARKEVYIKATVKGVKTNHKNVFKILCI